MQVILLATNEEPKLGPLAATLLGPLAPIANRPVIVRTLELLARAGMKRVIVGLCHDGGKLVSHLGDGSRWGMQIEYMIRREACDPAGALRWAAPRLSETFLVLPAGAIIDMDIVAALAFHRSHGAPATLIVHAAGQRRDHRPITLGADRRVLALAPDHAAEQPWCDTGACILEPQALARPAGRDPSADLGADLLAAGVDVYGYAMCGYWNPLASLRDYQEAQRVSLESAYRACSGQQAPRDPERPHIRAVTIDGAQLAPGVWVGPHHRIHPGARLVAPLCIGEWCRIGHGVELGPYTSIGSRVIIDDEATVRRSTILSGTYVGRMLHCDGRIVAQTTLIDAETAASTEILDPLLLAALRPGERPRRFGRLVNRLGALLSMKRGSLNGGDFP